MKKILITGGAGFIGSHLSENLSKKNKILVLDNLFQGNKLRLNKNINLIIGDVRDKELVYKLSKGCETIFHLAAIIGVDVVSKNKIDTMNVEFDGLRNICESAKKNKVKKIIYSSSSGVYGKLNYNSKVKEESVISPSSGYAMAKRNSEIYLENFYKETNINCCAVRLFNVYGDRQDSRMVISRFINSAQKGRDIIIYGDGQQTRDFTHISDCIKTFELLEKKITGYEIFNSSKGIETKIYDLAKLIIKLCKSKSKIKLIKTPKQLLEFQVKKRCGDSSKLKKYIDYKPTKSLLSGLKETYF